jgi:RimJ/RimL family protein N-acetyltransferase
MTRRLCPGDEPALERFLSARAESSMFLRSNVREVGLVDAGERLHGTYVAAERDGAIIAVASHGWNGMVLVQGDVDAVGACAREAVALTGRLIKGLGGPWTLVTAARAALGLTGQPGIVDSREDLFTLTLSQLRVPEPLADGRWICRPPRASDHAALARWSADYQVEALGATPSAELDARIRREVEAGAGGWVLAVGDQPCAMSRFTARLPDAAQIGGVYTPPVLRRRGYARAVVAGSLLQARAEGVERAILFTEQTNLAARTAYLALGFTLIGEYGLVLF